VSAQCPTINNPGVHLMTATTVDGRAVIASEPALSPLSEVKGRPIYYKQIVRLLLDDDREVFGCVHCDFTGQSAQSLYSHLKRHSGRKAQRAKAAPPVPMDVTLGDLLAGQRQTSELMALIEQITEDRNEWKRRAREAERRLKVLRDAIGGVR
jgi:hypothetical protein